MEQITELEEEVAASFFMQKKFSNHGTLGSTQKNVGAIHIHGSQAPIYMCFHYASLKSQYLMLLHLWPKVAAVKNRRERLISERVSLEESRRVAKEKLSRLESFICSSLGGQGWKIKVACLHLLFLFLKLKDKMADTFLK